MADVSQAWLMLMTAINDTLAFGDDPNRVRFQISISPQEYDFVSVSGLYNLYDFAERISLWQAGFLDSDKNVVTEYKAFLDNVRPNNPIDKVAEAQLEALKPKVQKARDDLNNFSNPRRLVNDWNSFNQDQQGLPPEFQLSFEDWYNQNVVPELTNLKKTFDDLNGQQAILENKAYGGTQEFSDAQQALTKVGFPYQDNVPVQIRNQQGNLETKFLPRFAWAMQPSPDQILQDIANGRVNKVSFTVTSNTSTYDVSSWGVGGSAGLDLGFISIGVQGKYTRVNINSSGASFRLTFTAVSTNSIVMTPRAWFDQGILVRYQNADGAQGFFGVSGLLNLFKKRVWLVYQPTVELQMDQASFREVRSAWSAGASLSIGPFSFGGGGSSSDDQINFDAAGAMVTAKSNSPFLQVFAVSSLVMPG